METRSNKFLVSFVVALVLAAIIGFTLWMTASRRSSGRSYDIVVERSVSGLVVGSPVTFSGVPVGRVHSVRLDPVRPGAVRVRIDITNDALPITEGTVATMKGDLLFGTTLLSLERESRTDRPILARAGEDAPLIPLQSGGMGDVVGDPTPMVESIAFATDRLLAATTPEQQRLLTARIEAMERTSAQVAAQGDALSTKVGPARQSLRESTASATEAIARARAMRAGLDARSRTATRDMKASLAGARSGMDAFNKGIQAARPGAQGFSASVGASGEQIRAAREGVGALKEQVLAVENGGVGAMVSGPPTPDFKPKKSR